MAFNGYVDEPFDVMCEGLFDNIEDILDFSNGDNVMGSMVDSCVADAEQLALPPPLPVPVPAPAAPSFHSLSGEDGSGLTEEHKICDELNITEDWLSNFLDDTEFNLDLAGAAIPTADVDSYIIKDEPLFRSSSPISVLEQSNGIGGGGGSGSSSNISSSSSSSNSVNNDTDVVSLSPASPPGPAIPSVPARARTKRPRPAAFAPRIHITGPSLPPSSDTLPVIPTPSLDYNSIVEPYIPPPMMKKKMMKNNNKRPAFDTDESPPPVAAAAVRKCMHCGIQKTPQWRAGPMGPKTLCNACGVRYKSGRLFPEYRPAASPTFVPSVHSNSHKKVVEMRIKATAKEATNAAAATSWKISPAAKNCDLLLYIRRKE